MHRINYPEGYCVCMASMRSIELTILRVTVSVWQPGA